MQILFSIFISIAVFSSEHRPHTTAQHYCGPCSKKEGKLYDELSLWASISRGLLTSGSPSVYSGIIYLLRVTRAACWILLELVSKFTEVLLHREWENPPKNIISTAVLEKSCTQTNLVLCLTYASVCLKPDFFTLKERLWHSLFCSSLEPRWYFRIVTLNLALSQ